MVFCILWFGINVCVSFILSSIVITCLRKKQLVTVLADVFCVHGLWVYVLLLSWLSARAALLYAVYSTSSFPVWCFG